LLLQWKGLSLLIVFFLPPSLLGEGASWMSQKE